MKQLTPFSPKYFIHKMLILLVIDHWFFQHKCYKTKYCASLSNLIGCGIIIVCYEVMPLLSCFLHLLLYFQQVTGELFEVDSVMLEKLDNLESHPHLYVRREIDINPVCMKYNGGFLGSIWYLPFLIQFSDIIGVAWTSKTTTIKHPSQLTNISGFFNTCIFHPIG